MATTTPNFGWPVPTSSDLVKNGATAIEALGDGIDASLLDLKGGTSGQVLKKNSNTDMDFVWSADSAGMTNPMTTTGDTIYSSSGSTPARLGIGTNGQVLTVAAGLPSWATPAAGGGGKVLQVVQGTTTTQTSNSTNVMADTGLSATITPSAATSKILVIVMQGGTQKDNGNSSNELKLQLLRGATQIGNSIFALYTGTAVINGGVPLIYQLLDAPNTTSATTYKTQYCNNTNAAQVYVQAGSSQSTIILMEIGA